jgi:hypothetical protein
MGRDAMNLHPLIQRLLDGDIRLSDLPPELRAEGERALRVFARVDRDPVRLSAALEDRVLTAVRERRVARPWWRWLLEPLDLRLRLRPWWGGLALVGIGGLIALLARSPADRAAALGADSAVVQFVFHAPAAAGVAVAGSFNGWNPTATPLARLDGVWTITLALPAGRYEYAFVVDGQRWLADPAAPAVDDGFGRRNSVIAVGPGARIL